MKFRSSCALRLLIGVLFLLPVRVLPFGLQLHSQEKDTTKVFRTISQLESGILEGKISVDSAARAYSEFARYFFDRHYIDEAKAYISRSNRYANQDNDTLLIMSNHLMIARLMMDEDDRAGAVDLLDKLYRRYEQMRDSANMLVTLRMLGNNYDYLEDHETALEYYERCVDMAKKLKDDVLLSRVYGNIAGVYGEEGDYEKSIQVYEQALPIALASGSYNSLFNIYQGLGIVYQDVELYEEARKNLSACLKVAMDHSDIRLEGFALQSFGFFHLDRGNLDSAESYMNRARTIGEQVNSAQLYYNALKVLQEVYYKTGRYQKAYDNFKELTAGNDSLYNLQNTQLIETIRSKYQNERNERELAEKNLLLAEAEYRLSQKSFYQVGLIVILIFTLIIIFLLYRAFTLRRKRNKMLRARNVEVEAHNQQIRALHDTKSRWFVNVAHELRTPLTLIKGPMKRIRNRKGLADDVKQDLDIVNRHADRLVTIVNEILDLSKMEERQMPLKKRVTNVRELIAQAVGSFESTAEHLGVLLSNEVSKQLYMNVDADKLSKLFINLISNALKHTPRGGLIKIYMCVQDEVEIAFSDTGSGIRKEDLPFIFDRFFQSENADGGAKGGTGIGLALSKEIVEMHDGQIEVESREGKGSTFKVKLPAKLIAASPVTRMKSANSGPDKKLTPLADQLAEKPTLLMVEDNQDMRKFVRSLLIEDFAINEAKNGIEGLEQLETQDINIILSDVMMPEMDGTSFLKAVKSDERWKNLPFVHLSALNDPGIRKDSFQIGIDDYLHKPFDPEELVVRVRNLYRNYLNRMGEEAEEEEVVMSSDTKIVNKLREEVLVNLDDSSFNVWRLADCAAMSERQIYRFLKKHTGLTPHQFIQEIKLNKAMEMIEQKIFHNVTQLSSAVGFQQPAYFSSVFEKRFGRKPISLMKS